jgi:hypothetical protein
MIYNLAGGDMSAVGYIRENFTMLDLAIYQRVKNYIIEKSKSK